MSILEIRNYSWYHGLKVYSLRAGSPRPVSLAQTGELARRLKGVSQPTLRKFLL